jgi:hypothetical protein
MKGIDVPIADPIAPVNDKDDRPSVKELIAQHREHIDEVKTELTDDPLYDPNKHDDLWIVRFLLSHKLRKNLAVKAAKHTLDFRKKYKLDEKDTRHAVPSSKIDIPAMKRYTSHCDDDTFLWVLPDPQRGVVLFMRYAGSDQNALAQNVAEEDWLPVYMYNTEWAHQWLDRITRMTGRLTKNVRFVDLSGMQFSHIKSEVTRRDSRVMTIMEDCYPQLLQSIYICNAPSWAHIMYKIVKQFMPERVITKFDIINPKTNESELQKLIQHVDEEKLPARFGGKNEQWPVEFSLPE